MVRLNVSVPDELAARARAAGLNVSALTQAALAAELERRTLTAWLDGLPVAGAGVSHTAAMDALDDARADLAGS